MEHRREADIEKLIDALGVALSYIPMYHFEDGNDLLQEAVTTYEEASRQRVILLAERLAKTNGHNDPRSTA